MSKRPIKLPENAPTYRVELTSEEINSVVYILGEVLGTPDWRKSLGCGHVGDALSARTVLRWKRDGRL